jgi:very-short-patch-repair endonuclease
MPKFKLSEKQNMFFTLLELGIPFKEELVFFKGRKYRFDFAIPDYKIGIEYEGINSSRSRHTSITGYTKDTEKYNLAVCNGWRVLRYTALNYKNLREDILTLIK